VGSKMGTIMAGADSMKITLFGVGGHGSQVSRYYTVSIAFKS
jgi:metal-dependent amidase/aminoacylase/carboxypeptidase family protein